MASVKGPWPSPSIQRKMTFKDPAPMMAVISGEITANVGAPIGVSNIDGRVVDVYLSLEQRGRDDAQTHTLEMDVLINGTSCLSTKPKIAANNGSVSAQGDTYSSGTGITQAVINTSADDVAVGDVLRYFGTLTRTASPTTEMSNGVVVVIIEPY